MMAPKKPIPDPAALEALYLALKRVFIDPGCMSALMQNPALDAEVSAALRLAEGK